MNKTNPIQLSDYKDSFNVMMGVQDTELDWFDNPYISPQVLSFDPSWLDGKYPKISDDVKLRKCND
jgi:hypothetical protein